MDSLVDMASDSDMSEEDDDYYLFTGYAQSMDKDLADDLSKVAICFGERAVNYRQLAAIDTVDIHLNVAMNLQTEIAEAWGLLPGEALTIKLHPSLTQYRRGNKPAVSVCQYRGGDLTTKPFLPRAGLQLTKILETFLSQHWLKVDQRSSPDMFGADDLSSLLEMGFSMEESRTALKQTRNRQEAVEVLLGAKVPKPEMKPSRSFTLPKLPGPKPAKLAKSQTMESVNPERVLTLIPSSTQRGLTAKTLPQLRHGFLVQLMDYVSQRLPTLNEYCVVCDEPHVFQNGAMLKPAVCSRELCVFAFGTLGVMADASDDIASGAEVIDLLMHLFRKSALCKRRALVLDPYPTVIDPTKPSSLAFCPLKKNWDKLDKLLEKFPSMSELCRLDSLKLKYQLDEMDPVAYPLLTWIIRSNRSHIVRLPPDKQLPFMHTPHQFLLLCSPPAKEAKFRAAKRQHGSCFAMHGSPIENWHSILRNGLVVGSGTRHQMNGAAYGGGIYLSPNSSVSMSYSGMGRGSVQGVKRMGRIPQKPLANQPNQPSWPNQPSQPYVPNLANQPNWPNQAASSRNPAANLDGGRPLIDQTASSSKQKRFLTATDIACIALCEVISSKETLTKHNGIWVSTNPDHVCTRFLFVYENGGVAEFVDTTLAHTEKKIREAVAYQIAPVKVDEAGEAGEASSSR